MVDAAHELSMLLIEFGIMKVKGDSGLNILVEWQGRNLIALASHKEIRKWTQQI